MRKKIFYFMHVDWNWIKQRPHHIAEGLSKYYDIVVVYPYNLKRTQLTKNNRGGIKLIPVFRIPFVTKFYILRLIDNYLCKKYIKILLKRNNPDYIWVTFPDLYAFIPENYNYKIIYDCMDDAGEFENTSKINFKRINLENALIKKSSLVLVSSMNLMNVIDERSNHKSKVILIRNAFDMCSFKTNSSENSLNKYAYKICYIGTVSSWFDFDALYFCVQKIKNLEFHIIGPVTVNISKWSHERIIIHGPKKYEILPSIVEKFDCTIMPFILNQLVRSVDPVKLYEYINYGKPIISIYYEEVERFSKYVTFYSSKEELLKIISDMIKGGFKAKYNEEERKEFLEKNSWDSRVNNIKDYLRELD